ncbi:MAG: hypothetical protein COA79_15770 [Planctomycetota bacterium]|nr:MAG: hypothetical protein COA79_15770 [Planctomycetota bacterium]
MTKPTIAAIDDEIHILVLIEKFFEQKFNVLTYNSGDEFLEKYNNEDISTIIMDWNMPGRDGIETLKEIKKRKICRNVPVAIHTGVDWTDKRLKIAVNAGATIFLHKGGDWHFTIYHIESLVNLYESQKKLNDMTTLISNSMQHNVNGWLTGIVTVGSMLPMFPEWGEGPFFDKIQQMIDSSRQLNKMNDDLSILLTNQESKRAEEFNLNENLIIAINDLSFLKLDISSTTINEEITLNINKKLFIRVAFYMGLYFAKTIGELSPILYSIDKDERGVNLTCSVHDINVDISPLFHQSHAPDAQQGTTLLAATFIRKSCQQFNAIIETQQENEKSFIKIIFN